MLMLWEEAFYSCLFSGIFPVATRGIRENKHQTYFLILSYLTLVEIPCCQLNVLIEGLGVRLLITDLEDISKEILSKMIVLCDFQTIICA